MAVPQNFRTAFNGFNREDVVRYIEYINAQHTAEVNQLTSEAAFLQEKLETFTNNPLIDEVRTERDDLKAQLAQLQERCQLLEQERDEALTRPAGDVGLQVKITELELQLKTALDEKAEAEKARDEAVRTRDEALENLKNQPSQSCMEELEYYRRAERIERQARERAEQVYRLTNGALADATVQVDEAAASISELADRVAQQLTLLQNAVAGSKQTLRSAAATMYAIRTGEEADSIR